MLVRHTVERQGEQISSTNVIKYLEPKERCGINPETGRKEGQFLLKQCCRFMVRLSVEVFVNLLTLDMSLITPMYPTLLELA